MSQLPAISAQTPVERFALIILGLLRCVGARVTLNLRSGGYPAAGMAPLPTEMAGLLYARLERARRLFAALAERVRLGTARAHPDRAAPSRPAPAAPSTAAVSPAPPDPSPRAGREPAPDSPRLPRGVGAVLGLLYWEAASHAEQLRQLLADPEMVTLIRSASGFARILRPICRMLGVEPPVGLFPPVERRPCRARRRSTGAPVRVLAWRGTRATLAGIGRQPSAECRAAAWGGSATRHPRKA